MSEKPLQFAAPAASEAPATKEPKHSVNDVPCSENGEDGESLSSEVQSGVPAMEATAKV